MPFADVQKHFDTWELNFMFPDSAFRKQLVSNWAGVRESETNPVEMRGAYSVQGQQLLAVVTLEGNGNTSRTPRCAETISF